ncbi:m-phase inducer phosphatase [Gurleya vavrai]
MFNTEDDFLTSIISENILTSDFLEDAKYSSFMEANEQKCFEEYKETDNYNKNNKRKLSRSLFFSSELSNSDCQILKSNKISIDDKNFCLNAKNKNKKIQKSNQIEAKSIFDINFIDSKNFNEISPLKNSFLLEFNKNSTQASKNLKSEDLKFSKNNFKDFSEIQKNFVLELPPFNSHWTLQKKQKSRIFSVPEPSIKNKKCHLLNFWNSYDCGVSHSLPTLGAGTSDSLQRVSIETVDDIMKNKNQKFLIVDCRFEYEFNGGHIINAVNLNTTDDIDRFFCKYSDLILIFHCEYSSIRAPRLARYLRNKDRKENKYPNLRFPEIYIMDGGYKKFYEKYVNLCEPMFYVSMDDADSEEYRKKSKIFFEY